MKAEARYRIMRFIEENSRYGRSRFNDLELTTLINNKFRTDISKPTVNRLRKQTGIKVKPYQANTSDGLTNLESRVDNLEKRVNAFEGRVVGQFSSVRNNNAPVEQN